MTRPTLLAAALLAALPATASAGTYSVYSCKGPTGIPNAATGWNAAHTADGATANDCAAGGALSAWLTGQPLGGSAARWRLDSPADTRVVRIAAQRRTTGLARSETSGDISYDLSTDGTVLEKCAPAADSACVADLTDALDKQGVDGGWLRFSTTCIRGNDERCSRPLRVDVAQAVTGLRDDLAPTVGGVTVTDDGDVSGVLQAAFDGADRGGGLYRTLLRVDGRLVKADYVAGGDCTDANPQDEDAYQFLLPVPCPLQAAGIPLRVDVATLAPGPHGIELDVEDAAGNSTAVYGPAEFPRANGSSFDLNAKLKMWFARNRARRLTSRFGTRVVTRGRLVDSHGRGIQGARIDVYHLVGGHRRQLLKTGLKTRANGNLTLILPLNVDTRRIEYAYRAVRPGPVTSDQVLTLIRKDRHGKTVHKVT